MTSTSWQNPRTTGGMIGVSCGNPENPRGYDPDVVVQHLTASGSRGVSRGTFGALTRSMNTTESVNASGTIVRRATELDVGSRLVVGGAIREVVRVVDIPKFNTGTTPGAHVSLFLDNGCVIVERASTLYTCVAA